MKRLTLPTIWLWFAVLMVTSWIGAAWVGFRMESTGMERYRFLLWNLFLAWIPYWAAMGLWIIHQVKKHWPVAVRRISLAALGAIWFLFLPNAPYLVTDLVHFRRILGGGMWGWSDIFMMMIFIWTGLLLGALSLHLVHLAIALTFGRAAGWGFVAGMVPLTAIGVYVGREFRWNSWEVITDPEKLLSDLNRLLEVDALQFILMASVMIGIVYGTIHMLLARPVR